MGQIYMPLVNWLLLAAVLLAVVGFGSSSALASAYGFAVTVTMFTTTLLTFFVVRHAWKYPLPLAIGATSVFLALDLLLVIACSLKFMQGGWLPLVLGILVFSIMASWRRGRELLVESIGQGDPELLPFLQALIADSIHRVPRTAVYAVASSDTVPQALMHNLKHNQVLHERNLILTVVFHDVPWIAAGRSRHRRALGGGILAGTGQLRLQGLTRHSSGIGAMQFACAAINLFETSYFLSREIVVPTKGTGMADWREAVFAFMSRNASNIADFLRLPNNCVIELGTRIQI